MMTKDEGYDGMCTTLAFVSWLAQTGQLRKDSKPEDRMEAATLEQVPVQLVQPSPESSGSTALP